MNDPLRGLTGERLFSAFDSDGQPAAISSRRAGRAAPVTFDTLHACCAAEVERRLRGNLAASGLVRGMIDYHLDTGGKRLRALLPAWVCANLDGDVEGALDVGVGLELLHNATLVHDDLQDGDTHRRGKPTVWCKWGEAQAINTGDALIFEAFACIARATPGPRLIGPTAVTSLRMVEGQTMEFQLQLPGEHPLALPATLEVWQAMARAKTGALFGLCLRAGAVAAGRSDAFAEAAARYGEGLGLLFQVQDDLLDLVGDKGRTHRGSDLKEGKMSLPIVLAFAFAAPDAIEPVRAVLNRPRDERTWEMVDAACEALEQCGALAITAAWLRQAAHAANGHPLSALVPGCVERFLAPVRHALGALDNDSAAE